MIATRRLALKLTGFGALAPLLPAGPARALATTRFVPSTGPMRYTRVLERTMADGAAFIVRRSFAVRFVPLGAGYRVEGEQVEITVDAPAKLARFAELERERRELGLFPLMLDRTGAIFGARAAIDSAALDAAVVEATRTFAHQPLPAGEREEITRFVTALHQNASRLVNELPADLFAPLTAERIATRKVALPDGESGAVTVHFSASADEATGMMTQARREVVTALSRDRRSTVENWNLARL